MHKILSDLGLEEHSNDTTATVAPEEEDRVPMLQRGVTLPFLRRVAEETSGLGRGRVDSGQWLNGHHTTSSMTGVLSIDVNTAGPFPPPAPLPTAHDMHTRSYITLPPLPSLATRTARRHPHQPYQPTNLPTYQPHQTGKSLIDDATPTRGKRWVTSPLNFVRANLPNKKPLFLSPRRIPP